MNNFLEQLKKYFEDTPQDKVLADWEKSAKFDEIGPTVDEFLNNTQQYTHIVTEEPLGVCFVSNNEFNPNLTSGFFI